MTEPEPAAPPVDISSLLQWVAQSQATANAAMDRLSADNAELRAQNAELILRLQALEIGGPAKGKGKGSTSSGYSSSASGHAATGAEADKLLARVTQPSKLKKESQWPNWLITFRPFVRRLHGSLPDLMRRAED